MSLYRISDTSLEPVDQTTFRGEGLRERDDLQRLLRQSIKILDPGLMVLAEEYGRWEDSRRRIDLLCLDLSANLVVVEIKRTEDGGHMELQSIRYASMVSSMTFARAVEAHREFRKANDLDPDSAEEEVLGFLGWEEPQEEDFANDVRIYLVSAEFSREITTSVLWLNEHEIDIRCVRLRPYRLNGDVLLDIQQIVPLPEAAEYQIQIRQKASEKRKLKTFNPDFTKYNLSIDGTTFERLPKRRLVFETVKACLTAGATPEQLAEDMPRGMGRWLRVDGVHDSDSFMEAISTLKTPRGGAYDPRRYFCDDTELFVHNTETYALNNQWGRRAPEVARTLASNWLNGRAVITVSDA